MIRTEEDADRFYKLIPQLKELTVDMERLSAKKPDGALNTFKVRFVNQLLKSANEFLTEAYMPIDEFTTFDETHVPTNSDVVVVLSQYKAAFKRFLSQTTGQNEGRRQVWIVDGEFSAIPAPSSLTW